MNKRRFVAPVLRKLSREHDAIKICHVACCLATTLTNIAGSQVLPSSTGMVLVFLGVSKCRQKLFLPQWSHLWCYTTADKMLHESLVVMYQNILHHAKNVHRRVREKFKPMLTPVYWREKKKRKEKIHSAREHNINNLGNKWYLR